MIGFLGWVDAMKSPLHVGGKDGSWVRSRLTQMNVLGSMGITWTRMQRMLL